MLSVRKVGSSNLHQVKLVGTFFMRFDLLFVKGVLKNVGNIEVVMVNKEILTIKDLIIGDERNSHLAIVNK